MSADLRFPTGLVVPGMSQVGSTSLLFKSHILAGLTMGSSQNYAFGKGLDLNLIIKSIFTGLRGSV